MPRGQSSQWPKVAGHNGHFCALLLVAAALGCERKAPSIEECQNLSATLLGFRAGRVPERGDVQKKYEQLSFECLTTPFDRALITCLERTRNVELCTIELRARKGTRANPG